MFILFQLILLFLSFHFSMEFLLGLSSQNNLQKDKRFRTNWPQHLWLVG